MKNSNLNYQEAFRAELNRQDLHFHEQELPTAVRFSMVLPAYNVPRVHFSCLIRPNGQVSIVSFPICNIPANKRSAMMNVINMLNKEQRYLKYYLDDDDDSLDLGVEFELILYEADPKVVGNYLFRMVILASDILDKALPKLLTELWKKNEQKVTDSSDFMLQLLDALSDEDGDAEGEPKAQT